MVLPRIEEQTQCLFSPVSPSTVFNFFSSSSLFPWVSLWRMGFWKALYRFLLPIWLLFVLMSLLTFKTGQTQRSRGDCLWLQSCYLFAPNRCDLDRRQSYEGSLWTSLALSTGPHHVMLTDARSVNCWHDVESRRSLSYIREMLLKRFLRNPWLLKAFDLCHC